MKLLPKAEWTENSGLRNIVEALGGEARYVGGAVRDTLLRLPVTDVDIATPLVPESVVAKLEAADIKAIPTGIEHGTITAVSLGTPVEITTLRRDVSTDGRRATVAFSDDWKEDAARRDFTINAMSVDPETLEIHDYFDGLTDLEARNVRFIGDANERIAEDHLRIMRYFRFLARFGRDGVEETAYRACVAAAPSLKSLSRERIADELMKLLAVSDPRLALHAMFDGNIFDHIVAAHDPEAAKLIDQVVEREQQSGITADAIRRFVALVPKDAKAADAIGASLKLSNKRRRAMKARLSAEKPAPDNICAIAYRTDKDSARDCTLLFAPDNLWQELLAALDNFTIPIFPLKGGDLIAAGLEPGPQVAITLQKLEAKWIADGFPPKPAINLDIN